jgi:hypothetical protein
MNNDFPNNMGDDEAGTTLPPAPEAAAPKPKKAKAKVEVLPAVAAVSEVPKRVRILLEENDNIPPTGQYFGINGKGYMLRPGEETEVPVELLGVLNDAVQEVPVVNPQTQQVESFRKKLRFPYRVLAKDI